MYRQLGLFFFGVLVMNHSTKQYNTRSHSINWVSVSLSSYWATFTSSWKFFAYCWRTWNDSKRLLKCKLIFLRSQLVKPHICSYDDQEYKQKFFFSSSDQYIQCWYFNKMMNARRISFVWICILWLFVFSLCKFM